MTAIAASKISGTKGFSLGRYARVVRRATYSALAGANTSHRQSRRRRRTVMRWSRLRWAADFVLPRTSGDSFARRQARRLRPLGHKVISLTTKLGQVNVGTSVRHLALRIARYPYVNRRMIRRLARKVISLDHDASPFVANRLALFSQRILELNIPIVSALTRHVVEAVLLSMLGLQMAAGHMGTTRTLARFSNLAFRPNIRARRSPIAYVYFQALHHTRQHHRILNEVPGIEVFRHHYLNHLVGAAHLYVGDPHLAIHYLERALTFNDQDPNDYRLLGRAYLKLGDKPHAARCFRAAINLAPNTVMAHQNYAGRYDIPNYKPKAWELEKAESLLIYDNFGQLAEDTFLLGRFDESYRLYQCMLEHQRQIQGTLPDGLIARLRALDPRIDADLPFRLLPYEWVTQYGHIGLLDSYMKMAKLGMYPKANYLLLAPPEKVSNKELLSYWDAHYTVVRDPDLVDELFPYQRMIGDNFQAYPGTDGLAEPWTRAAARAHIEWARDKRPALLEVSDVDREVGIRTLAALNIPEGAWYVSLHVREGGYYAESGGGISTHRNASIEDYIPAIRAVTERGGYVIRLGDKSMRPLPKMERAIDYALSPQKSARADNFFCATSRFVIGTTSGLTTVCLSFGTPAVLVNCISNDWQLWSGDTDFIVKRVWNMRDKRFVPFSEVFTQPVQGYLINADVMRRRGLISIPNSPQEIEAAVRYKLDLMDGRISRPRDDEEPMRSYWNAMALNPMMFGAAHPVAPFLDRHPELLAAARQAAPLKNLLPSV